MLLSPFRHEAMSILGVPSQQWLHRSTQINQSADYPVARYN
jgi:hypothetical protein